MIERILRREKMGNLRTLKEKQGLIDFASNDYLGLARSKTLADETWREWQALGGVGSTGSRLLTGNSAYVEALEAQIAAFHGYPEGVIFNCGYMANIGLISSLCGPHDTVFFDAAVHASLREGISMSRTRSFSFRHNDLNHLESRIQRGCYICVESVYSIDGTNAPLKELCSLAAKYDARLIVDEAHAVGVIGPKGRGLVAELKLEKQVFAQVVTFGKALGAHGAIVLGSDLLKRTLINFATSFIYTTALPFHSLAAIKASYDLFPLMEKERKQLKLLGGSHIQAIPFQGNAALKATERALQEKGFDVRGLMSPTVRRGHEVLRICLHAFNKKEDLACLLKELECHG